MEQAPLAHINEATIKEHDGIAVCIWLTFSGTKCGTRVLIDSGAGISLIPLSVYNEMTLRPPLQRSDRRINGANAALRQISSGIFRWIISRQLVHLGRNNPPVCHSERSEESLF